MADFGPTTKLHAPTRTAEVVPAYGMRPEPAGWGLRGWRVFCPRCGFLSTLYDGSIRSPQTAASLHRCERRP